MLASSKDGVQMAAPFLYIRSNHDGNVSEIKLTYMLNTALTIYLCPSSFVPE